MREDGKRVIRIFFVAIAVILGLRFGLKLIWPFLLAFPTAALLKRTVIWLNRRLRVPRFAAAGLVLAVTVSVLGFAAWKLMILLVRQGVAVAGRIPVWLERGQYCLHMACCFVEEKMPLAPGTLEPRVQNLVEILETEISQKGMKLALNGSGSALQGFTALGVGFAFYLFGTLFLLGRKTEHEKGNSEHNRGCPEKMDFPFRQELIRLKDNLLQFGKTYLLCEVLILLLNSLFCVVALWITGNSCAVLLGLLIGIMDTLPILGAGLVLIPWGIWKLIQREIWQGLVLFACCGICYMTRELMEARMMGNALGISPFSTMISVYAGMQLFGLAGILLGPIAILLIREILRIFP